MTLQIILLIIAALTTPQYLASAITEPEIVEGDGGGGGGVIAPPNMGHYNNDLTCFINSTMQILFHLLPFRDFLREEIENYTDYAFAQHIAQIINTMASNTSRLNLNKAGAQLLHLSVILEQQLLDLQKEEEANLLGMASMMPQHFLAL